MATTGSASSKNIHVVMFPYFAFGHISPFVQLSNKLVSHGIQVSFFSAPANISRIKSTLKLSPQANIVPLTIPHVDGLPHDIGSTADLPPGVAELLKKALDLMQNPVKSLLAELKPHFVFFDFAQPWIPKMATELGIKSLYFSVFSAIPGAYVMVPARRPRDQKCPTISDLVKPPIGFPSASGIALEVFEARDYLYVFKSFNGGPCVYDRIMTGYGDCTALVIKTCYDMEGPYIDFLKTQFQKPVLLTGPLVSKPVPTTGELEEKWANWLGKFPPKSVIYCSFGSETFLNEDQIQELALGLELTGLPFFLVLNFPADVNASAELDKVLPEGFRERVKDRGVVHTGWVQQQLILAHENVGCFLCHSGFSSVIEALVNDCQLVLLPFKGDQFLNARLVSRDLKAGVEINRRGEDGYFGKEDVKEAVNVVMTEAGKETSSTIRKNQQKWREFLLDDSIQDQFISELVENLKAMA